MKYRVSHCTHLISEKKSVPNVTLISSCCIGVRLVIVLVFLALWLAGSLQASGTGSGSASASTSAATSSSTSSTGPGVKNSPSSGSIGSWRTWSPWKFLHDLENLGSIQQFLYPQQLGQSIVVDSGKLGWLCRPFMKVMWLCRWFRAFVVDSWKFLNNVRIPFSTFVVILQSYHGSTGTIGVIRSEFVVKEVFVMFYFSFIGDSWLFCDHHAEFRPFLTDFEVFLRFCGGIILMLQWGWGCCSECMFNSGRGYKQTDVHHEWPQMWKNQLWGDYRPQGSSPTPPWHYQLHHYITIILPWFYGFGTLEPKFLTLNNLVPISWASQKLQNLPQTISEVQESSTKGPQRSKYFNSGMFVVVVKRGYKLLCVGSFC